MLLDRVLEEVERPPHELTGSVVPVFYEERRAVADIDEADG
jgi:hypothetical protein